MSATLLEGGRLIDGTGAAPRDDCALLMQDERITAVGEEAVERTPDDARRITDQTVLVADGRVHPPQQTTELFENPPQALRDYLGDD